MNRILLLLPLALLTTVPHAAPTPDRLGFVNVEKLVASVPGSTNYLNLRKKVNTDLGNRQATLQTLVKKYASTRKAADQQAAIKAQKDFLAAQKTSQTQLASAFKPLATKINSAIATAAKNNGFTIVVDQQVAARTHLFVYANPNSDLTAAALKAIK